MQIISLHTLTTCFSSPQGAVEENVHSSGSSTWPFSCPTQGWTSCLKQNSQQDSMLIDAQTDHIHQSVIRNHWTRRSHEIRVIYRGQGELPSQQHLATLLALVRAVGRLICVRLTQSIKHFISKWPPWNAENKITDINSWFESIIGSCWRECVFKPQ